MAYVLIFSLLAPAFGYTAGIKSVADTLAVKLTSLVASLKIWVNPKNYERNNEVIDLVLWVIANELDDRLNSSLSDYGFIVAAEIFELR